MSMNISKILPTQLRSLTPIQIQLYKDLTRFIFISAGRRSRKTLIADRKMLVDSGRGALHVPEHKYLFAAPTRLQAKNIYWNKLLKDTLAFVKNPNKDISYSELSIKLYNNSVLQVVGLDRPSRVEGQTMPPIKAIHITEMGDVKPELWGENIRPILSDTDGFAIIDGVPETGAYHYKELCNIASDNSLVRPEPNVGAYGSNINMEMAWYGWLSSDVLSAKEIEQAKKQLDDRVFKQEYEGAFLDAQGVAAYNYSSDNYLFETYKSNRKTVLCWDFNYNPATCLINQQIAPDKWCYVDELNPPDTSTQVMIELIKDYFEKNGYPAYLEVTGDYSGKQRRSSAGAYTDWILIEEAFGVKAKIGMNRIKDRVNAFTSILKRVNGDIIQYINIDKCKNLHKDISQVAWKENGYELDSQNGKIGHMFDAATYFAVNYYPIMKEVKGYVA